jgi:hypothetical protein
MRNTALIGMAMAVLAGCGSGTGSFSDGGIGGGGSGGGGGNTGMASCTLSQSSGAGLTVVICQEATGLPPAAVEQLRQGCMLPPDAGVTGAEARFSNGLCSRTGAIGGCRQMSGGFAITQWFYDDGLTTPADIMMLCSGAGGTFVPA